MKRALSLAARHRGMTSPNPPVGAVIVRDGKVISEGTHEGPGKPHAEAWAIATSSVPVTGADLYVTLEPCSHYGRTPPCTEAVISSAIKRVFIGMRDPNPDVRGGGADILRKAGLDVTVGVMSDRVERFYEAYTTFVTKKLPFVTLKAAMTLDGKLATSTGDSKWISSEKSRRLVHHLRAVSDAVMVGLGTVKKDDPLLNVRMVNGRDPMRVVIDSGLEMSPTSRMLREGTGKVLIVSWDGADPRRAAGLMERGADIVRVSKGKDGMLKIEELLVELGKRDVMSLLVEGGANIFTYFIKNGIFNKILLFFAPKILTGADSLGLTVGKGPERISDAFMLNNMTVRRLGEDLVVEAYREGPR